MLAQRTEVNREIRHYIQALYTPLRRTFNLNSRPSIIQERTN